MKSKRSFIHFNAGEWSPKAEARVDHAKYPAACRQLQNAIPMPHGPVSRRKGFQFITETKDSSKESRLMRFQFSRAVTFCIEAGDEYFRFIRDGALVESGGSPYEIASPYLQAEVKELQFAQVNDVVFIVHKNHAPRTLSRLADDNWVLTEVDFDYPTLLGENTDASQRLALSQTEGTAFLTATGHSPFKTEHIGSYWAVGHRVTEDLERRLGSSFEAGDATGGIFVVGKFTVDTTGLWGGEFDLEQDGSDSFGTAITIKTFTGSNDKNYSSPFESPLDGAWYRFKNNGSTQTGGGGGDDIARLTPNEVIRNSIVKVTAVNSSTNATVDILINALSTDSTDVWNEGAFSDYRGFPQAVTFFENRILYAATAHQPQTFWGSVTDDYYNFRTGEEDTDSYDFTPTSPERNEILWLGSSQQLLIGTSAGEWLASGNDIDTSITPTSIIVRKQSSNGSIPLRPILLEGTLAYMQRGGRKLRAMSYDGATERFGSADLSILSDHITAGGVISMAYQAQRDSIIWATTGLGKLIGMTYEPDQGVIAWHRHETKGDFEWVETIYGDGDDEVYVIVKRVIGGEVRRYIESFRGYYNPTVDGIGDSVGGGGESSLPPDLPPPTDEIDCATSAVSGGIGDETYLVQLGTGTGTVTFNFNAINIPDRFTVYYENQTITTGFRGDSSRDQDLIDAGYPPTEGTGAGSLQFIKGASSTALVRVEAPLSGTAWNFTMGCPDGAGAPESGDGEGGEGDPGAAGGDFFGYTAAELEQRFVDSSLSFSDEPATVFEGLDHLEGETVQILADGGVVPDQVVIDGTITIPVASSVVHIGLKYETIIQPMRIDVDSRMGIMQAKEKSIYEAVLYLMDTGAVSVKASGDRYDAIRDLSAAPLYGEANELYTGETAGISIETGSSTDPTFILRADQPLPFTLVAAILKYNLTGE